MTSSSSTWKAPFFCLNYGPTLCRHLNTDQPIYALHCLQTATEQELERMNSLEQMASFCLRDLRTVQRRGPYYLSGYCLHAIVAFDMGQRLMAQGEEVALLAMFDPPWLWLRMHQRLGLAWGKWKRRWRTMVSHSKAAPGLPEEVAHADGPAALRMRMFAAARSYVPEKYSGRMELFLPGNGRTSTAAKIAGWRGLARSEFGTHYVSGEGTSIFDEPHVHDLGQQLRRCLFAAPGLPERHSSPDGIGCNP